MDNILEVSGLNKRYGDFALKDISFYLPDGCITGFVGINGAGKTTTLRSILGLTNKVSGNIKFFGMNINGNESKIKDRIGIVLDEGGFYDELTLSEMKNVIAPRLQELVRTGLYRLHGTVFIESETENQYPVKRNADEIRFSSGTLP